MEFNGHTYSLFINIPISWEDARKYCISIGGHLATVTTEDENNLLLNLMKNGSCEGYWLGAGAGTDGWIWITRESFSGYSNFAEPVESTYKETQYMQISNTEENRGKWFPSANYVITEDGNAVESNVGFICEWEDFIVENEHISTVKIDSDSGKIKIDIDYNRTPDGFSFAALYGNSFLPTKCMGNDGKAEVENIEGNKKYTIKMFFWDKNLKPISKPIETEIFVK